MRITRLRLLDFTALLLASSLAVGCSEDNNITPTPDGGTPDANPYEVPYYTASGSVVDFYTGEPVAGDITVATRGLYPEPTVEVTGADFTVPNIPPSSVFNVEASGPNYRTTFSRAVEVVDANVYDLTADAVAEDYLTQLNEGFQVTPTQGTAILIAKVVDENGAPLAGVPSNAFYVNGAAPPKGPYFLDDNKQAAPGLDATGASGYVIFYDVPINADGNVVVAENQGSGYYLTMAVSPTYADAVTLAYITASQDQVQPPPEDVSFANDIVPIFEARGCQYCHSGGGAGRQDANLSLQGGANLIYSELTEELSPGYGVTRVDLQYPEQSLILTMPGPVIDNHPNTTFASVNDPDYQLLLAWIQQGALDN